MPAQLIPVSGRRRADYQGRFPEIDLEIVSVICYVMVERWSPDRVPSREKNINDIPEIRNAYFELIPLIVFR